MRRSGAVMQFENVLDNVVQACLENNIFIICCWEAVNDMKEYAS